MKASELRIGNWINLYGDDCRVQTVGMWLHTDTTVDEASIESVKPIDLTEEWLLKFGFYFESNIECRLAELRLIWDVEDDGWYLWTNTVCMGYESHAESIGRPLKYVHQLQNLYFALTGTELELK